MVIVDDGVGLPEGASWPAEGKHGALILQTLRENTKTKLKVQTAPSQGTRVTISFVRRPENLKVMSSS
jgi:nitrate/nitrite-specific signal transduction histidine kinase